MTKEDFIAKHKGNYVLKSPYKNRLLAFKIARYTFDKDYPIECETVEYKGSIAHPIKTAYKIEVLLNMIETGLIKLR